MHVKIYIIMVKFSVS